MMPVLDNLQLTRQSIRPPQAVFFFAEQKKLPTRSDELFGRYESNIEIGDE